jgi:RAB protein geranylgeranyltransferase component A
VIILFFFSSSFEDEDDIIDGDQHYERDVILHFDMFDIQRQMESMTREMEDMFKNFGGVEFFPGILFDHLNNDESKTLLETTNEHNL